MNSQPPILKILVVDDHAINLMVTLKMLQSLGYEADIAVNGQEAIEAVARLHYDIILMDCQMPILDGYGATCAIRQWEDSLPQPRKTVIVALSADHWDNTQRIYEAGMDGYLSKPVSLEALARLLDRWSQQLLPRVIPSIEPLPASVDESTGCFPLDLNHLHRVCDYNPEFELELLHLFISDSQLHLLKLQQAIDTKQLPQIEQAAHHIRGASANVGAKAMQAIAEQIEKQAYNQQLDQLEALMLKLKEALQPVQQFVENRENS